MVIALAVIAVVGWITQLIPLIAGVAGVTMTLGMMWRTRGFVKGSELQGQLEQKDEVIHTNEQTIESFRNRLSELEKDLAHMTTVRLAETEQINDLTHRLEILQQYSAPEVVRHFEEVLATHRREVAQRHERMLNQLDAQTEGMKRVTAALERMERRLSDG
jgi:chromosome segregation ATPase